MSGKIILVDVDLTVVNPVPNWWHWMECITETKKDFPEHPNYNLTSYFKDELDAVGKDGMDYWRHENIYDTLQPIDGSVESLKLLHDECGLRIVFASHIKRNHYKSKYQFLKRYFPFMEGFLGTKEKYLIRCDYMVDDRIKFINTMPEHVMKVRYITPYTQCEELKSTKFYSEAGDWKAIENIIKADMSCMGW
jgi:5'(3')-deoxyribonucleotidase